MQAYQVELESMAVKLEEENEQLLREKVLHFDMSSLIFSCYSDSWIDLDFVASMCYLSNSVEFLVTMLAPW